MKLHVRSAFLKEGLQSVNYLHICLYLYVSVLYSLD